MSVDNQAIEPTAADIFYGAAEVKAPTGQAGTKAVTESDDQDALTEEVETTDQPVESELDESEESEGEDGTDAAEDGEQELVYLDLDGKEVDLQDVRKWRDGHLMQADYTRKTTELAEERKVLQAEREQLGDLSALHAELQALVQEDEAVNWAELREDDPEEYIALKEKADKRKSAVEKLKTQAGQPQISDADLVTEQKALFSANPSWLDKDNKPTAAFEADQKLVNSYFQTNGFTSQEVSGMVRARYIEACLKAAKFDELQKKGATLRSKAKKATLVTKPSKQARQLKAAPKSREEIFYG